MTLYYLRMHLKETASEFSLITKLRLLLKLRSTIKRLADKVEGLPPENEVEFFEKFNAQIERWIDSGLIKDGYHFFEGDYVFMTGDLTADQLSELKIRIRTFIIDFFRDIAIKIGVKSPETVEFITDEVMQFEIHRVLPLRRALAAQLAAAKRGVTKAT